MTILVSGASGFVGSAITRHLLEQGHKVYALSRSTSSAIAKFAATATGRRALAEGHLSFVEADVTRPDTLVRALEEVAAGTLEAVIQAVQFRGAPVENPKRDLTYAAVDRDGTLNLLGALARFPQGSPRFLYVSGITVSPTARGPWNRAKWQAEEAIRGSGLDWTIVRCCWVYGPEDRALNRLLGYADRLPFLPVFGAGEAKLSPLFIEDVGRFFTFLLASPEKGRDMTFALGGPDTVTLNDFLELAQEIRGHKRPLLHVPKSLGKVAAALVQYLPGRPLTPDAVEFVSQGGAMTEAEHKLLAERFPEFRLTPLREGLSYLAR